MFPIIIRNSDEEAVVENSVGRASHHGLAPPEVHGVVTEAPSVRDVERVGLLEPPAAAQSLF
jgi:hypothetical protein